MHLTDVPVDLDNAFGILRFVRKVLVSTCFVAIYRFQRRRHQVKICRRHPRDVGTRQAGPGRYPARRAQIRAAVGFGVDKEKQLVFDDRPAEAEAKLVLA